MHLVFKPCIYTAQAALSECSQVGVRLASIKFEPGKFKEDNHFTCLLHPIDRIVVPRITELSSGGGEDEDAATNSAPPQAEPTPTHASSTTFLGLDELAGQAANQDSRSKAEVHYDRQFPYLSSV